MKLFRCLATVAVATGMAAMAFSSISEASATTRASVTTPKKVCLLANTTNTPYSALLNVAIAKEGKKIGLNVQNTRRQQ